MKCVFRSCLATILFFVFMSMRLVTIADPGRGLKFTENRSQWPARYDYGATIPGGSFFVQPGVFTYLFFDQQRIDQWHEASHRDRGNDGLSNEMVDGVRVETRFIGANHHAH